MAGTIDSALGIIVPLAAFLVLGFAIYKGFQGPIDSLLNWIKERFSGGGNQQQQPQQQSYGRRSPYGIDGGDISYR